VPVVIVEGAAPAPPPTTKALDASAPEEAQVVPLEKYGTPPEVPATVSASVPEDVTGDPETETIPPVNVWPTDETVPAAARIFQYVAFGGELPNVAAIQM
jgi:hypothetical protein